MPDTYIGRFNSVVRDKVLSELENDPDVIYYEPDRIRKPGTTRGTDSPNEFTTTPLWGMLRIGAPDAWREQTATRSPIRVAVIEQEFDTDHRDLVNQASLLDLNSLSVTDHATHVSGIIAATGNNNTDVVGVSAIDSLDNLAAFFPRRF